MRILIGCETSGRVRRAFAARGHFVTSVDLLPADDGAGELPSGIGQHHRGDLLEFLAMHPGQFDIGIFHPECRYLTSSGLHWNTRRPERAARTVDALRFVEQLWCCGIPRIAIENPQGCISTRLPFMPRAQYVQPYQFGADASKRTGLWLKNLPPLVPTYRFPGRVIAWPRNSARYVERWSNQTDSGQNRLTPSPDRWKLRSETYQGIADAMAEQWSAPDIKPTKRCAVQLELPLTLAG